MTRTTLPAVTHPPAEPQSSQPAPCRSALAAAYQVLLRASREDLELLAWAREHLVGDNHWVGDGPLSPTDREYLLRERSKMEARQPRCECCARPLKDDEGKVCHACERRVNHWLKAGQ